MMQNFTVISNKFNVQNLQSSNVFTRVKRRWQHHHYQQQPQPQQWQRQRDRQTYLEPETYAKGEVYLRVCHTI